MGMLRERQQGAVMRYMVYLGVGLLAAPVFGQAAGEPSALVPRIGGPAIQVVALEGDRVGSGQLQSVGPAYVNREGDIAFDATLVQNGQPREGLFTWSGDRVTPLAVEGQETGHGPLLLTDPSVGFGEWMWGDGARALFLGAADANRNGVFDPGVDPQFLFLAERGQLIPLLRLGDPIDGGRLLSILSFRVNSLGQVAFQALIDRNGDGVFTRGIDRAGVYLLTNGRRQPLVREGDHAGDGFVRELDMDLSSLWQFNDRGEVLLESAGLEVPAALPPVMDALILADKTGVRLVARGGLQTPFGAFSNAPYAALNDRGDLVLSATVLSGKPGQDVLPRLFLVPASEPANRLELLAQPGDPGPDQSPIADFIGLPPTIANDGSVAFCASYPQPISFVEGQIEYPTACFVQRPEFRYEVARVGNPSPWGVIGGIGLPTLNDRAQAAVEIRAAMFPFDPVDGPGAGPEAILFWENGMHIGVVGAGDLIPGGQVGITTQLIGLSNNGRLAFETTVTDDRGVSRNGIFVALVSGER